MTRYRRNRAVWLRRRRGTALIEFAMAVPFIALVIAATFFFGWSMVNQQHLKVADRYTAWRYVRGAGNPSEGELNDTLLDGNAGTVSIARTRADERTVSDFIAQAGQESALAEVYAEHIVADGAPRSRAARVSADFPSELGYAAALEEPMTARHGREGREWRRRQVDCERELTADFLYSLDDSLMSLSGPVSRLGRRLTEMYTRRW